MLRPLPFPSPNCVEANNNCWSMVTPGDARSDDTEHAGMPVAIAEDDGRGFRQIPFRDFCFRCFRTI